MIIAFLIIAALGISIYLLSRKPHMVDDREQAIIDSLTYVEEIGGITVKSRDHLPFDVVQGILQGFTETFAKARALGYTEGQSFTDYTVLVFPSVRNYDDNGTYSPVFQVFLNPKDPYIGSVYDHGGWIYAAERVLTRNGVPTGTFIIADNTSREYTARAVTYGLEHLLLFKNDRSRYEATKTHLTGGHPLF